MFKVPNDNGLVLGSAGKVGSLDGNASDPLGVSLRKRVQAVARNGIPELDGLVSRTRQQVVAALQISNGAHFVLMPAQRLCDRVGL